MPALFVVHVLNAQLPFNTKNSVNVNKINATVLVHGDMWWDPVAQLAACEFPPASGKHVNFAGALWLSGYDAGGTLRVAAQSYRQKGNDYWPGPLDVNDTLTYATAYAWAKIWKVSRTDIQYFHSLSVHTIGNTPDPILTWPAKGNVHARGNGGISLYITEDMAPFIDLNSNGIYEPLSGDYPDVRGDQALWWVFSDNGPTHTQTDGKPLGIEVHAMAYAYNRNTLIDYVVYYDYTIINKSPNNYSNFRAALWNDIDLGYYLDDYMGFDSTWRMSICYNGTNCEGCAVGSPVNSYGSNPPQSGVTMVVSPGDVGASYVPAGSFVIYINDGSPYGNLVNDTICNNYMRSKFWNGQPIRLPNCCGYDTLAEMKYIFTGDPGILNSWNECRFNNNPTDRKGILSTGDFTLNAGDRKKVVFAQVVADSAGGCGPTSFNKIKIVADTAWKNYFNPPAPLLPNGIGNLSASGAINIYPNPAHDKLYIEYAALGSDDVVGVYNTLGQYIGLVMEKKGKMYIANIEHLPPGAYTVLINGWRTTGKIFLKN